MSMGCVYMYIILFINYAWPNPYSASYERDASQINDSSIFFIQQRL